MVASDLFLTPLHPSELMSEDLKCYYFPKHNLSRLASHQAPLFTYRLPPKRKHYSCYESKITPPTKGWWYLLFFFFFFSHNNFCMKWQNNSNMRGIILLFYVKIDVKLRKRAVELSFASTKSQLRSPSSYNRRNRWNGIWPNKALL